MSEMGFEPRLISNKQTRYLLPTNPAFGVDAKVTYLNDSFNGGPHCISYAHLTLQNEIVSIKSLG